MMMMMIVVSIQRNVDGMKAAKMELFEKRRKSVVSAIVSNSSASSKKV